MCQNSPAPFPVLLTSTPGLGDVIDVLGIWKTQPAFALPLPFMVIEAGRLVIPAGTVLTLGDRELPGPTPALPPMARVGTLVTVDDDPGTVKRARSSPKMGAADTADDRPHRTAAHGPMIAVRAALRLVARVVVILNTPVWDADDPGSFLKLDSLTVNALISVACDIRPTRTAFAFDGFMSRSPGCGGPLIRCQKPRLVAPDQSFVHSQVRRLMTVHI